MTTMTTMTPSERRRKVEKAIKNYRELLRNVDEANRLTIELLAHPDTTPEQVEYAVDLLRARRARVRQIWRSLQELTRKEGCSNQTIAWVDDNPPWEISK